MILFSHPAAIAVSLGDDVLDRDRSPLPDIEIEQAVIGATQDLNQLVGQVERIMNSAIHAHAAAGAVEMGRVSRQQDTARPIGFRYALMDAIGALMQNIVLRRRREDALQLRLHRVGQQRILGALSRLGVEAASPQLRQP